MEELHISQDVPSADLWAAHSDTAQKCQHILQDTQWEQPHSELDVWTPQTTPAIKSHCDFIHKIKCELIHFFLQHRIPSHCQADEDPLAVSVPCPGFSPIFSPGKNTSIQQAGAALLENKIISL